MGDTVTQSNKFEWTNLKNQYLAAVAVNIVFLAHGCINGWLSPALPVLLSADTPLKTGPLTNDQLSWIGSIGALAGILGNFLFGSLTTCLGCKNAILTLTIPSVSFWFLIYFGDTYYHILTARFCMGFCGGGIQTTVILYVAEIANDNIRGTLSSISHVSRNFGILSSYVLGAFVEYQIIPCIFVFAPITFVIWFSFLPNTPQYLLKKGQIKQAEDALKHYKGYTGESVTESIALKAELERLKVLANDRKVEERISLSDFVERESMKGMLNGIIIGIFAQLTGYLVFITYAGHIFKQVGASQIDPNVSSIAIAVMMLCGTLCTTRFSDTLGRKALLIISLAGSAFGLLVFALYSYLQQNKYDLSGFEWVPVTSLSFCIFISSSGVVALIFVCVVENLPTKIRTVGLAICNTVLNIMAFICLKMFPILMVSIGLHGCLLILGIASLLGAVYVHIVIKETKGLELDRVKSNAQANTENASTK